MGIIFGKALYLDNNYIDKLMFENKLQIKFLVNREEEGGGGKDNWERTGERGAKIFQHEFFEQIPVKSKPMIRLCQFSHPSTEFHSLQIVLFMSSCRKPISMYARTNF